MPRLTRDARLETREARSKLKKPQSGRAVFWRSIHQGLAIGYRTGEKGAVWIVRKLIGGDQYTFQTLGQADDRQDANGVDVLSYQQAHRKALEFSNLKTVGVGPYTIGEAAREYIEYVKAKKKSGYTVALSIKAHVLPYFENRQVDSLTKEELERWHNRLSMSPVHRRGKDKPKLVEIDSDPETVRRRRSAANRVLGVLKAMLNRAKKNGRVTNSAAWDDVEPFRGVSDSRKIFLQEDQCKRLINAAQGSFRAYVQTLLYTGARPGKELEYIRVRDFDEEAGTVRIPDGKTGGRDVFLTDEGVKFFSRLTAGRAPDEILLLKDDGTTWKKNHHIRPMKAAAKAARLPAGTNAYALRHTYISLALKNGMNIKVLADSCGTSIRMIEEHYAKFLHADRRKMFNAAIPSFGFKDDGKVRAIR